MNDYLDLTDKLNDIFEQYMDEGIIVDLDGWGTGDVLDVIAIFDQVLELRSAEYAGRDSE